jgi:hypothetical protein
VGVAGVTADAGLDGADAEVAQVLDSGLDRPVVERGCVNADVHTFGVNRSAC